MVDGGRLILRENLAQTDPPPILKNTDFQSAFAHSASAITPSENSSINTNSFPMSLRWTLHVAPKPSAFSKGSKTQSDRFFIQNLHSYLR